MYPILKAEWIAPQVRMIELEAPHVAKHHQAGHFVIVRVRDKGERIPLTIATSNAKTGTIALVVQVLGATTDLLCSLNSGETIANVAGPLGKPTEIENFGLAVLVGGGVGTAVIIPQAKALKEAGNTVWSIIGGRTKEYVILEKELGEYSEKVFPCTNDGSYGYEGFVSGKLQELIDEKPGAIGAVLSAGPVPMMRAVAEVTKPRNVRSIASLNPIMVDGTGMCGCCRVTVAGKMKFACVDGPEFDAHEVDFLELIDRLTSYRVQETAAWDRFKKDHQCRAEHK